MSREDDIKKLENQIRIRELENQIKDRENRPFTMEETLSNVVPSGQRLISDVYETVKSVPQAAGKMAASRALGEEELYTPTLSKVLSGAAQHATGLADENPSEAAQMASGVKQMYKARYGSFNAIKNTAMTDPMGALMDASGIGAITAGGLKQAAKIAGAGQKVVKGLEGARKVATALDPMTYPTHIGKVLPVERMYRGGFSPAGRDRADVIETAKFGLENEIRPTDAGLAKTKKMMGEAGDQRQDMLDTAGAIHTRELTGPVLELEAKRGSVRGSARPEKDATSIADTAVDYVDAVLREFPDGNIPAAAVNDMKTSLYKQAAEAYDQKLPSAVQDTYKALARGAKEALEKRDPRIEGVNKEMGLLGNIIETLDPGGGIRKAEGRSDVGIDFPTRRITNSDGMAIAVSMMKNRAADLAIVLNRARTDKQFYGMLRQALVQAGRTQLEAEEELRNLLETAE